MPLLFEQLGTDPDKRQQLLLAAARCFVKSGFHGARMAQIAEEARMSPGHIYHYFESKKDIIAAIINQYASNKMKLLEKYHDAGDRIVDMMIENVEAGITRNTDLFWSTLLLDMAAEASRNSEIGDAVRKSDAEIRTALLDSMQGAVNPENVEARFEVLIAIMQGLGIRQIMHPDFDKTAVMQLVQQIVELLFRPPANAAGD